MWGGPSEEHKSVRSRVEAVAKNWRQEGERERGKMRKFRELVRSAGRDAT